jgi:hypothetical protein
MDEEGNIYDLNLNQVGKAGDDDDDEWVERAQILIDFF